MSQRTRPPYFEAKAEYLRPWKLVSLACGLALLIAGAHSFDLPDWDVPISLIMATITYFTASSSLRVLLQRRRKQLLTALFWTWFSVDGSYAIYWYFKNPAALELRSANAAASLALYGMCAVLWLHRGSLRELAFLALQRVRNE